MTGAGPRLRGSISGAVTEAIDVVEESPRSAGELTGAVPGRIDRFGGKNAGKLAESYRRATVGHADRQPAERRGCGIPLPEQLFADELLHLLVEHRDGQECADALVG